MDFVKLLMLPIWMSEQRYLTWERKKLSGSIHHEIVLAASRSSTCRVTQFKGMIAGPKWLEITRLGG